MKGNNTTPPIHVGLAQHQKKGSGVQSPIVTSGLKDAMIKSENNKHEYNN